MFLGNNRCSANAALTLAALERQPWPRSGANRAGARHAPEISAGAVWAGSGQQRARALRETMAELAKEHGIECGSSPSWSSVMALSIGISSRSILNGTQTVPLQLASEPSASSCEMVRSTLHLKPQGADLHREISDKRFNALIYFQFCHSTCP
jgi:hypothetical protein